MRRLAWFTLVVVGCGLTLRALAQGPVGGVTVFEGARVRNGARFLKLTDTGTIEAKKSADFLVPDANPLDDITNTRKIASVYLRGAVVDTPPRCCGRACSGLRKTSFRQPAPTRSPRAGANI
jgi:hypothetical protein